MVAWLLKCNNYFKTFFMNFNKILQTMWNTYFSCSKQTFYIIRMPISYSSACAFVIFKYTSLGQANKIYCFSGIFFRKTHAGCGFFFLLQTTTTIS